MEPSAAHEQAAPGIRLHGDETLSETEPFGQLTGRGLLG